MPFKFPYTNFQELNLDWIIKKVKDLSKQIEDDSSIVSEYIDRLIAVEDKADNAEATATAADARATGANNTANSALTLATQAKQTAEIADLSTTLLGLKIGDLSSLFTTAKDTIVNAINEIWSIFHNATAVTNVTPAGTDPAVTYSNGVFTFDLPQGGDPDAVTHAELDAALDELSEEISEELDNKADVIIDTASGDPATFPDGTATPLLSLVINVEPVQNLNGQDAPYPPGGGANICDPLLKFEPGTYSGVTLATTDGYNFILSGTATANENISCPNIPVDDCVVYPAGTYTSIGAIFATYKPDGSWYTNRQVGTWVADSAFIIRSAYLQIIEGATPSSTPRFLGLAKGSTVLSSWSPYSNICPISGRNGCSVNVNGDSYSVNFGETLYGAKPDLISGQMPVTYDEVDMGTLTWASGTESGHQFFSSDTLRNIIKPIQTNAIKPTFKTPMYITTSYWDSHPVPFIYTDFAITQTSGNNQIRVTDSRYSTAADFKDAMSGVKLVYEVAVPDETSITPNVITALEGNNTVQSDAGSVDVTYRADTKGYIDKLIAHVQALALGG